jgi:hypothetical protein
VTRPFDRDPLDAGLFWRGPGVTAFVGRAGPETPTILPGAAVPGTSGEGEPEPPPAAREAADPCPPLILLRGGESLPAAAGGTGSSELSEAVRAFFAAGGRECLVAARGGARSGDGGIDWRGAVNLLSETEEAGTIVLLGASAQGARDRALQLAGRRQDLYFILEGRGAERAGSTSPPRDFGGNGQRKADPSPDDPVVLHLRENAALVRPGLPRSSPGLPLAAALGGLAGFLEASDFALDERFRPLQAPGAPPWLTEPDRRFLTWWRRREGLRRSLDLGTRWTFLEPEGPLLGPRVQREVSAFLRRLEGYGLLEGAPGEQSFDVECGWPAGGPGRIALRVRASVRPAPIFPHDPAPAASRREPVHRPP